ncbi:MAG: porin family protein [Dysgonamonadaceae bacterium]|jgi:hypothetical protein|nr:porin family protein [Dysgonamonadaceae bacterium]
MKLASRYTGILILLFVSYLAVGAQEYRYELGGAAGAAFYLGDANESAYFRGMQPAGGLIFRDNLNFHWAIKANLLAGRISGDTKNEKNVFPNHAQTMFERTFFDLGGQMEFNFLPYSDKYKYLNTSKLSPYILAGLGLTLAPGNDRTFFGINFPLGVGVKYKLRNKLNLGVEYTVRRLFSDSFDAPNSQGFNLDNPYRVNQSWAKNKDWYNTLLFSITWEFGLRDGRCTTD